DTSRQMPGQTPAGAAGQESVPARQASWLVLTRPVGLPRGNRLRMSARVGLSAEMGSCRAERKLLHKFRSAGSASTNVPMLLRSHQSLIAWRNVAAVGHLESLQQVRSAAND